MLEIKKVSYIDKTVGINVTNPQRKEKSPGWECKELPLPSFNQCLQELMAVQKFLPLNYSHIEKYVVKSVTIQHDAGSPVSAKIGLTLYIKEKNGGGVWNIVSTKILLSKSPLILTSVENVITEAKKYLNYERAQGEFFKGENSDKKVENDEAHEHTKSLKKTTEDKK